MANRKSSSEPRRGRNPEINASVLQYFKDSRNEVLPVTREALISKAKGYARNSNITFKTCENL
jgi:hypothetical protein